MDATARPSDVEVDDLEQTLDAVESASGKTTMPPADVPGGPRIAYFEDPEGNRIGLTEAGTLRQSE